MRNWQLRPPSPRPPRPPNPSSFRRYVYIHSSLHRYFPPNTDTNASQAEYRLWPRIPPRRLRSFYLNRLTTDAAAIKRSLTGCAVLFWLLHTKDYLHEPPQSWFRHSAGQNDLICGRLVSPRYPSVWHVPPVPRGAFSLTALHRWRQMSRNTAGRKSATTPQ